MKKIFLFFCILMLLSCDKIIDQESADLAFAPRRCSKVYIVPGIEEITYYDGVYYSDYKETEGAVFGKNQLFLSIQTTNNDRYPQGAIERVLYFDNFDNLNSSIPDLEQQIEKNYYKNLKKNSGSSLLRSANAAYSNLEVIEYRITGVQDLKIYALDAPLFGKSAGESLNDFLDIVMYQPKVIASSQTKNLLYGFTDKPETMPKSIDKWLALKPLAQPTMYLKPNTSLGVELPVSVRFVVQLKTDEGVVLSDTTRAITVIN
jgi:hypothetical protein